MLQRNTDATFRKSGRLWSSFGMGISPSIHTHAHTHTHVLYIYMHKSTRACLHAVTLVNADASACRQPIHTHTNTQTHFNCLPQLKSVTKDAVCQKRVSLSQNISKQCTATSVLRSSCDLLQNTTPFCILFDISQLQMCFAFSFIGGPSLLIFFSLLLRSLFSRMKNRALFVRL